MLLALLLFLCTIYGFISRTALLSTGKSYCKSPVFALEHLSAISTIAMTMTDNLSEKYPEAAPYIREAVKEHGEEWVIENYHPKISQLGTLMDIPEVEELPFYDEEKHDTVDEQERKAMARALREYRENLRTGHKPDKD